MSTKYRWFGISLFVAACGGSSSSEPEWTVVAQDQPSALLALWSSTASDVWAVGGDQDGAGPLVEHYDGNAWTKLDTQQRNLDLWWVKGFEGGPVFVSGSAGTILRFQNNTFEKLTTPGGAIVFGMWGASPTDMWAVGGNPGGGGGGFVWRFDGTTWTEVTGLPSEVSSQGTCFKVNGTTADDVWISATNGFTLHWDGAQLVPEPIPDAQQEQESLFSISGTAQRFVAVGGAFDGVLYENDGSGWVSAIPRGGPVLTGVFMTDTDAYAVGSFGAILHRVDGTWKTDKQQATTQNLHATWIDQDGGAWAVGGQFDTPLATTKGVLIYKGDTQPATF